MTSFSIRYPILHILQYFPSLRRYSGDCFIERSSGKRRDVYWPSKQLWRLTAPSGLHHIFCLGKNIPPQDPSFAGEKLVYPFLSDFLSAIFLKLGLDFRDILFIPGLLLTVAFYCILYYFTYRLTKSRFAAIISAFIFFFYGWFRFLLFLPGSCKHIS